MSLIASTLFAVIFLMPQWLEPLTPEQMFGWRVLLALPFIAVLLLIAREWSAVRAVVTRLKAKPALILVLVLDGHLLGVQLWLFAYAPASGLALDAALGYFLLPLVMVVGGLLLYRERLTGIRLAAVIAAVLGVAAAFLTADGLSWAVAVIALGYPLYFVLRRRFALDTAGALVFEMLALVPVAAWFALSPDSLGTVAGHPTLIPALLGFGIMSALALTAYIVASRSLSFGVFGLLGYVEPLLLVVVAVTVLGNPMQPEEVPTSVGILLAVVLLTIEGIIAQRRAARELRVLTEGAEVGPLTGPVTLR